MLTRTAIDEGTIEAGRAEESFRRVRGELKPMWRRFADVRAVRVQRTTTADEDCRPIAMILETDRADRRALDDCLASNVRPELPAAAADPPAKLPP